MNSPACCTDLVLVYPKLFFREYQSEDEREFIETHGLNKLTVTELQDISEEVGDYMVKIHHRCEQLTDAGLCKIYENRPKICRLFDCSLRKDCDCKGSGKIEQNG